MRTNLKGRPALDNWTDIGALNSQAKESTGSPDQKPLALYERIIKASSNENEHCLRPLLWLCDNDYRSQQS